MNFLEWIVTDSAEMKGLFWLKEMREGHLECIGSLCVKIEGERKHRVLVRFKRERFVGYFDELIKMIPFWVGEGIIEMGV